MVICAAHSLVSSDDKVTMAAARLHSLSCTTRLSQSHIEAEHGPVNIDAVVGEFRFGEISIRYIHVVHAG